MAHTITLSALRVRFPAQTGPGWTAQASSGGMGEVASQRTGSEFADLLPPDEAWVGGAVQPGPALGEKCAPSALKVMAWAT